MNKILFHFNVGSLFYPDCLPSHHNIGSLFYPELFAIASQYWFYPELFAIASQYWFFIPSRIVCHRITMLVLYSIQNCLPLHHNIGSLFYPDHITMLVLYSIQSCLPLHHNICSLFPPELFAIASQYWFFILSRIVCHRITMLVLYSIQNCLPSHHNVSSFYPEFSKYETWVKGQRMILTSCTHKSSFGKLSKPIFKPKSPKFFMK